VFNLSPLEIRLLGESLLREDPKAFCGYRILSFR
jgi:hypothetical protein